MSDIVKKVAPPVYSGLKKGIAANRANFEQTVKSIDPNTVPNRLGLVIDDSGSMGEDGMQNVYKAVRGFTNSCNMKDTSIAVYPLNRETKDLICDYDVLNFYVGTLKATDGTPIYGILQKLIETVEITRCILFSDGSPTDSSILEGDDNPWSTKPREVAIGVLDKYIKNETPIDTIFIGHEASSGYKEMQKIAELTGGTFIHFMDTNSLSTGLKYLAPKYRALLANPEIKARIERGETI